MAHMLQDACTETVFSIAKQVLLWHSSCIWQHGAASAHGCSCIKSQYLHLCQTTGKAQHWKTDLMQLQPT